MRVLAAAVLAPAESPDLAHVGRRKEVAPLLLLQQRVQNFRVRQARLEDSTCLQVQ